jgi:hypothetical protein
MTTEDGKNTATVALGRVGRKARAEPMMAKRRKELASRRLKSLVYQQKIEFAYFYSVLQI